MKAKQEAAFASEQARLAEAKKQKDVRSQCLFSLLCVLSEKLMRPVFVFSGLQEEDRRKKEESKQRLKAKAALWS